MTDSRLPHVTEVIKAAGLMGDMSNVPEGAKERGTAVHLGTQFLDEDDLDWDTLQPDVEARVRQYEKWKVEMQPEILAIEKKVESPLHGYCGTLDRIVRMNGSEGVLDIKGPYRAPWHGVQTAAYAAAVYGAHQVRRRLVARWSLHLDEDRYLLIGHSDPDDFKVFRAALDIFNWKRRLKEA